MRRQELQRGDGAGRAQEHEQQSARAGDASLVISFRTSTLPRMLERAVSDASFARRRARWMVSVLGVLARTRLLRLASLVPATLQPIMDVRLTKRI